MVRSLGHLLQSLRGKIQKDTQQIAEGLLPVFYRRWALPRHDDELTHIRDTRQKILLIKAGGKNSQRLLHVLLYLKTIDKLERGCTFDSRRI
ncbi:hypothetical protein AQZ49_06610 [Novosphingobium sp. FSW06-99]|nr:hypothetical protein AQZ49_06610 [Novosphingobium sp. FSW06-99]